MKRAFERNGAKSRTASGRASGPPIEVNAPPRTGAPGKFEVVLAPARHMSSLLKPPQPGQFVEKGTHSATHSATLPTMSKAPLADTQSRRVPVSDKSSPAAVQPLLPLSRPP